MSLKHAILGFLSFRPLSGYDLKKAFDHSVQHFWSANQSQIYRTLAQIDEEGLVEKQVVEREERLDMKIYSITEAGRGELHRWLSTPLPEQDDREPILIQVYFSGVLSDDEILNLLQTYLKSTEERLAVYRSVFQIARSIPNQGIEERTIFFSLLTLEAGFKTNQAVAEWLRTSIQRIQQKNYSIDIPEK